MPHVYFNKHALCGLLHLFYYYYFLRDKLFYYLQAKLELKLELMYFSSEV